MSVSVAQFNWFADTVRYRRKEGCDTGKYHNISSSFFSRPENTI